MIYHFDLILNFKTQTRRKNILIIVSVSILFSFQSCSDKELDNLNIETNNPTDFEILISSLFIKEGELIDEIKNYGETEELPNNLISLTVFKYSLIFCLDAIEDDKNPWHNYITDAYIK